MQAVLPAVEATLAQQEGGVSSRLPSTEVMQKMLAAGAVILALSGCDVIAQDGPDQDTSPSAAFIKREIAFDAFRDALLAGTPKPADARQQIATIANGNTGVATAATAAVNAGYATLLAENASQRGLTNPKDGDTRFSDISDPNLRGELEWFTYVTDAGELVRNPKLDGGSIAQSRTDLANTMPGGAEQTRDHALRALDAAYAHSLVTDLYSGSADESEVRANLGNIKDPAVLEAVTPVIDGYDASDAVKDLYLGRVTAAEARADIANITDPHIRARALQALEEVEATGDPYAAQDDSTELYLQANSSRGALDVVDADFDADVGSANTQGTRFSAARYTTLEAVDVAMGRVAAETAALTPKPMESFEPLVDLGQKVDLSDISGELEIANACIAVSSAEGSKGCGPETYNQFGEIYAKDGSLHLTFREDSNMTPALRAQFETVFAQTRPLLEAAFASGELVTVRYIVADSFDPGYVADTRELYMVLPGDDSMTLDQLAQGLTHETMHALTRNLFAQYQVSEPELKQLSLACNELRKTVYEDFEDALYVHPEWLEALHVKAKPEHKKLIETIIASVREGNLAETLAVRLDNLATQPTLNECFNVLNGGVASGNDVVLEARDEAQSDATYTDLSYLLNGEEAVALKKEWAKALTYGSVYDDIINESNYATADPRVKPYLGHGEDNAKEMCASIANAALAYKQQFSSSLGHLNNTATVDEYRATQAALKFTLNYIAQKHPSLQTYMWSLRDYYVAMGE